MGEGVNGVRGPHPMKLGQNKDGNQMPHQSIDTTDFRALAAYHLCTSFECQRVNDGMFTLGVEGFFRVVLDKGLTTVCSKVQNFHKVPSLNPLTALPFFFQMTCQHIMHIYMHSAKKAFSSLCIYICTLFIILCFHGTTASSM